MEYECLTCGKPFKQIDKQTLKPTCKCHKDGFAISVGYVKLDDTNEAKTI